MWLSTSTADDPSSSLTFSADGRSLFFGYWTQTADGNPEQSYLDRWPVGGGSPRRVALGAGSLDYAVTDGGAHVTALVGDRAVTLDADTLQRGSSVA